MTGRSLFRALDHDGREPFRSCRSTHVEGACTQPTSESETPTLYADYICPFCYLEHRSIERYRQGDRKSQAGFEIDWHPYDLRSDGRGPDGELEESRETGYPERVSEEIARLQERHDVEEMLDPDAVPHVDSLPAQVASLYVESEHPGRWPAFDDALFAALWNEGRDISDEDVLTAIAEDTGMNDAEVREAPADGGLRDRLFESFAEARERGVTDVPTLVYGERTIREVLSVEEVAHLARDSSQ